MISVFSVPDLTCSSVSSDNYSNFIVVDFTNSVNAVLITSRSVFGGLGTGDLGIYLVRVNFDCIVVIYCYNFIITLVIRENLIEKSLRSEGGAGTTGVVWDLSVSFDFVVVTFADFLVFLIYQRSSNQSVFSKGALVYYFIRV